MGTYKQFTGAAPLAKLTGGITGTPVNFTVDNATGFPTGAGGVPFVVCVDRNVAGSEEKILCSTEAGNTFNIQTRGFDGTSQVDHSSGATVEHVIDADSMNDSQQHIHVTTRDDHTQYLRTDGTRVLTGPTGATATGRLLGAVASGTPNVASAVAGDAVISHTGALYVAHGANAFDVPIGGLVAHGFGASQFDVTNATVTLLNVTASLVSGHKYLVHCKVQSLTITGNPTYINFQLSDSASLVTVPSTTPAFFILSLDPANVGDYYAAGSSTLLTPGSNVSDTLTIKGASSGPGSSGMRVAPNSVELSVVRVA